MLNHSSVGMLEDVNSFSIYLDMTRWLEVGKNTQNGLFHSMCFGFQKQKSTYLITNNFWRGHTAFWLRGRGWGRSKAPVALWAICTDGNIWRHKQVLWPTGRPKNDNLLATGHGKSVKGGGRISLWVSTTGPCGCELKGSMFDPEVWPCMRISEYLYLLMMHVMNGKTRQYYFKKWKNNNTNKIFFP